MRIFILLVAMLMLVSARAAQVNEDLNLGTQTKILRASNTALSVAASGNTTLLDLDVKDIERIYVQIAPTVQALDAFIVQIQPHSDGSFVTIASAAADFTSPTGIMVGASGDLTALAASATGWFILDTRGIARVKILASAAAAGAATVSIFAGGH